MYLIHEHVCRSSDKLRSLLDSAFDEGEPLYTRAADVSDVEPKTKILTLRKWNTNLPV
jgi:hypothetical protein